MGRKKRFGVTEKCKRIGEIEFGVMGNVYLKSVVLYIWVHEYKNSRESLVKVCWMNFFRYTLIVL